MYVKFSLFIKFHYYCHFYSFKGCDSGFGHSLAERLDAQGYTVFAGCLMPDREGAQGLKKTCSDKLHVVPIDVTDDWQVRGAVKYVKENIGDNSR